jgi:hypothetical protein
MKKNFKLLITFLFVLSVGLLVVGCTDLNAAEDAYVTVDINPSVELIVTPRDKVIYANPLNEDGELLLLNLTLVGLNLDEALELIIDEAIALGFIDVDSEEPAIVSIDVISKNSELGEKVRTQAKEKINNAFVDRAMVGRAEDKGFVPEFLAEAESYGVTPGFLRLAKSAIEVDDLLTLEEAVLLTQEELMDILKEARQANQEVRHQLREEFHAQRQLIFDEFHPQIAVLEEEIAVLEALIEAGEGDLEAYQVELDEKLAALEALVTEFRQQMTALRTQFHEDSEALRAQMMLQKEVLREALRPHVQEFLDQREQRREDMMDQINDFQGRGNRP